MVRTCGASSRLEPAAALQRPVTERTRDGIAVATLNGSGNLALADLLSHHSLLTA